MVPIVLLALGFAVVPGAAAATAVRVSSVAPAAGPTRGGARVHVTGSGFSHITSVRFGGNAGHDLHVTSSSSLYITTPPHAHGIVDVVVRADGHASPVTSADRYEYVAAPAVRYVRQNSGPVAGGRLVVIHGNGLRHVTSAAFGGVPATELTVLSSYQLQVRLPAHAAGRVDVQVAGPGGVATSRSAFQYIPPPTLFRSTPLAGSTLGGDELDLIGADLLGVTHVFFGTTPGAILHKDSSALTVTTPAHDAGSVAVTVTGPYGSAMLPAGAYTFMPPSTVTWTTPVTIDQGFGVSPATGLACLSETRCLAIDAYATYATSDGATWSPMRPAADGEYVSALTCANPDFCVAGTFGGLVSFYDGQTWSEPQRYSPDYQGRFQQLSCGGPSFCLGVAEGGRVFAWNGTTWSQSPIGPAVDVSCASPAFCVAVAGADAWQWNGAAWSTAMVIDADDDVAAVSCPTDTFCVALALHGGAIAYRAGHWTTPVAWGRPTTQWSDISCADATRCLAVSTSRFSEVFDGVGWSDTGSTASMRYVSCPSTTTCVGLGPSGASWRYRDGVVTALPTALPPHGVLADVSCANEEAPCIAADSYGNVLLRNGSEWSPITPLGTNTDPLHVSCTGAGFCAVAAASRVWFYRAGAWSTGVATGLHNVSDIACSSQTSCLAVSSDGLSASWDGQAWSGPSAVAGRARTYYRVSCASPSYCVWQTDEGLNVWDGHVWSALDLSAIASGTVASYDCSIGFCLVAFQSGAIARFDGTAWTAGPSIGFPVGTQATNAISCASSSYCMLSSAAPYGSGVDSVYVLDAGSWFVTHSHLPADNLACVAPGECVALSVAAATGSAP